MEMATGMASMIGYPGGQPETTGPSYLDPIGGFNAAAAILTALLHRQRTGEGQAVEVPQVEAAMQLIGAELLAALEPRGPRAAGQPVPLRRAPRRLPGQGRGRVGRGGGRDRCGMAALCRTMGRPELADDPRFATLSGRCAHEDELSRIVADWTASRDKHEAARILQAAGVPAAPVQTPQDLARSAYLQHRGFYTVLEHAEAGRHPYPGLPIRLGLTPGRQVRAAPAFGGDNITVLRDILKMEPEEIAALQPRAGMTNVPLPGA
jgi:crotonobetainyl-CoA:carnitine CoA-transferase CaiB-like acyl-CoA transferase